MGSSNTIHHYPIGGEKMGFIKTLSDKLNKGTEIAIGILLAVMSVVIFMQVIYRYVFHASLPWSEELGRYILVYLTFLGASVAVKKNAHIGVEVIVKLLPRSISKVLEWVANALSLVFFVILIVYGSKVVKITMMQLSPAMHVKMGYIYIAVVIGAVLMVIHLIARLSQIDEVEGK
jgi:TRAP-type C4-dicarboxylate transport system permease small subunit